MDARRMAGWTLAGASALWLAACAPADEGGETPPADTAESMETPAGGADGGAMGGPGAGAPGGGAATAQAALAPVGASGVRGEARIAHSADAITVTVRVTGAGAGSHAAHIHGGTCETGGPPVVTLESIETSAAGEGESTTSVAASELSPDEAYYVQVHAPGGTPVACGDLPSHPSSPGGGGV